MAWARVASRCESSHRGACFLRPDFSSYGWTSGMAAILERVFRGDGRRARGFVDGLRHTLPLEPVPWTRHVAQPYEFDAHLSSECFGLPGIDLEVKVRLRRSGYQVLQGVTCEFHEGTARFAVTCRPSTSSRSPRRSSARSLAFARLSIRSKSAPGELPDTAARPEPDPTDWPDATGCQP